MRGSISRAVGGGESEDAKIFPDACGIDGNRIRGDHCNRVYRGRDSSGGHRPPDGRVAAADEHQLPAVAAWPVIAKVVVDLALDREFDYRIPPHLAAAVHIGSRVTVPFGRRNAQGYVVGIADSSPFPK